MAVFIYRQINLRAFLKKAFSKKILLQCMQKICDAKIA